MLIGLGVRDVVLIEGLDLAFGPGLTALTGETGAGKSIILHALGLAACSTAWSAWRAARERAAVLQVEVGRSDDEAEELALRLSELDRLDPREAEEAALAEERALLGAAEKTLADIAAAADHLRGEG